MDPKRLRCILAILREGTFSAAAKRLYISQPALSQYIFNMEEEYGCKIFHRDTHPITLTYEGELFVQYLRQAQQLEADLLLQLEDAQMARKGRLSLGISPMRAQQLLPQLLPTIFDQMPELDLRLIHGSNRAHLTQLALDGEADFCITSGPIHPKLDFIHLATSTLLLMIPLSHPVAQQYGGERDWRKKPPVDLKKFEKERFIIGYPFQGGRSGVDAAFSNSHFFPEQYLETFDSDTTISLVEAGVGVTLIADTNVLYKLHRIQASCFRLTFVRHENIRLCYRHGRYISPLMERFIDLCKTVPNWPIPQDQDDTPFD